MKKLFTTLSVLLLAIIFTACTKDSLNCDSSASLAVKLDTLQIESSMKGWELYSWPEDVKGCIKWNYAVLPGTNRLKTLNEVSNEAVLKVAGAKQLKLLLSKFPVNENIQWVGEKWLSNAWGQSNIYYGNLKLPSTSIINEIKQHCIQRGLKLTIAP